MGTIIAPDYLSVNFDTYKDRVATVLRKNSEFKDFDFTGSNLSVLIELLAYQNEINTYYLNKLSSEVYDDSVQLWENAWRIASMKGYKARGYVSAKANLTVSIPQIIPKTTQKNFEFGDTIYIPYGTKFTAEITDNVTNNKTTLQYINTAPLMLTVPTYDTANEIDLQFTFNVPVVQGEVVTLNYIGNDIVDNTIILPFYQFNHDVFDTQEYSTMSLSVQNEFWTRVPNFYSAMSQLNDNFVNVNNTKVFSFIFNKYQQYIIEFGTHTSIPDNLDEIEITILKCEGAKGNVGKGLITKVENNKIINVNKQLYIQNTYITVNNLQPASGGQNPQNIEDLVEGGRGNISSQERCVTAHDYVSYLKSREDIYAATAYGEKEITRTGNVKEYNKVHISLVPSKFGPDTVVGEYVPWETDINKGTLFKPLAYYSGYVEDLKVFLEPRKFLTTYEQFEVPDLVYFAFHIGLRISSNYNFVDVANNFMNKLQYYFATTNRNFADTISFMDMHNWLIDTNIVTPTNTWELIKGIENIVFRKIWLSSPAIPDWKLAYYALPEEGGEYEGPDGETWHTSKGYNIVIPPGSNVYPPNDQFWPYEGPDRPVYTSKDFVFSVDNKMKVIVLGPKQFPVLATEFCGITQEF